MTDVNSAIELPPLLNELYEVLARQEEPVYLVGGAVRDMLLGRPIHDFDFAVRDQAIKMAFRVANRLGAPAYVLDKERDSGRVVLQSEKTTLDFAQYRASDLESDLRARDFTINAMALPAGARSSEHLIDPCGGQDDISNRLIRQTHSGAISDDPVRALRAVRFGLQLQFELPYETAGAAAEAASMLGQVSKERVRDEFVRLMGLESPDLAMAELQSLTLLAAVLPDVAALDGIIQTEPHHEHVLAHTARVMKWVVALEMIIQGKSFDGEPGLTLAGEVLAPYAHELQGYLEREIVGGLDGSLLLRLGALFHDVGKAATMTIDPAGGRIRFIGHENVGAKLAQKALRNLRLSNEAVTHVGTIVYGHMRPLSLTRNPSLSRRAIHRYFRATGQAGLDIALLALADQMAILDVPGATVEPDGALKNLLNVLDQLYAHYWERYEEVVRPVPLLNGRVLMDSLRIPAGPEVGRLLRLIEEAQAAGEVTTLDEALSLAGRAMRSSGRSSPDSIVKS